MDAAIDLQAYLERIGHEGGLATTLETLGDLQRRHVESIPFESLDPLLGRPVRLDAASLERKLVRDRRGGYCFEQNLLFRHVLEFLGFRVAGLAARVLWNAPEGAVTPRTHMVLRVDFDEKPYLVDVGFGGQCPTGPLGLEPEIEQATPHEPYQLVRSGEEFSLRARIRGDWRPLYRFDLREQHLCDYEVANWYVSTHPDSGFATGLLASRAAPGLRYGLRNNELAVHSLDGGTEHRILATPRELRETLEGLFGLALPETPELDATLARLVTKRG